MNNRKLAIITARGGSKRIPKKNIKEFCGKPILCYSIEAARDAGVFDEIMVSTDDMEIAQIACKAGASVPFFRSAETAGDYASTDDVIMEVLTAYQKLGQTFDSFCCIYPTAPFLSGSRLKDAMVLLKEADSVMPVVPFSYPPQRGLIIKKEGFLARQFPEYAATRSQDLPKIYHDCGQFYACRTDSFLQAKTTDVEKLLPLVLTELEVQDIDTLEDWTLAEMKYKLWKG
ncbi:pseudaminic acid cytidylyltransferase [Parablautia muri]|uniref:Pseudaminic acid cytidylyltransferase n=1 Tax=Parablautia muri TaxID=2320879 RepID=A0A9X5BCM3_9FIRM|nr:pseudaminic acid cytidylyltransferase [Parablautia muri]NBJ91265.1 pseudaminic acid cytidylyltransferase [Parablautia muri]